MQHSEKRSGPIGVVARDYLEELMKKDPVLCYKNTNGSNGKQRRMTVKGTLTSLTIKNQLELSFLSGAISVFML